VNFLSNAVKYTNEGFVTLGFSWKEERDRVLLCISVQDTGIGIDPGDVERLFESFTRAEGPSHRVIEGSGLGLAIAKELSDLMGGTIRGEQGGLRQHLYPGGPPDRGRSCPCGAVGNSAGVHNFGGGKLCGPRGPGTHCG